VTACEMINTYFVILEVGAIEVAYFSIVDDIATPFGVCSHRSCSVALVITAIDLLGCQR
jgi:hypothetical protein